MSAHFNQLTPAQAERLAVLAEECAEVIQVVGKILRHGYESTNPFDVKRISNRSLLTEELGHLQNIANMMALKGDFLRAAVESSSFAKEQSIGQYLHHQ